MSLKAVETPSQSSTTATAITTNTLFTYPSYSAPINPGASAAQILLLGNDFF